MPRRTRTATPPMTAPAMSPGDGEEDLDEVAGAGEEVDCVEDGKAPESVGLVDD
jgi:hypothetical protein